MTNLDTAAMARRERDATIAAATLRSAAARMREECLHVENRVFCMARAHDLDRWAAEAEESA